MRVLITGASGFIGSALCKALLERGDEVVAWMHRSQPKTPGVQSVNSLAELEAPIDAVINLAGAPIADARWSDARKTLLRESRLNTTRSLVEWIGRLEKRPAVLISGSAIGYYGATTRDEAVTEGSAVQLDDFSHALCRDWEQAAQQVQQYGVRVCTLRTGIVLGRGGALAKMRLPFLLGGGGPIASGRQWMPWIHIDDEVGAILHLLGQSDLSGPFNLTSPNPATNREFVKAYAASLNRPAIFPMPSFVVSLMLGRDAGKLLTEGLRVVPEKLLKSGYEFRYPQLETALRQVETNH